MQHSSPDPCLFVFLSFNNTIEREKAVVLLIKQSRVGKRVEARTRSKANSSSYIYFRELNTSDGGPINNGLFPIVDIFVNRKLTLRRSGLEPPHAINDPSLRGLKG